MKFFTILTGVFASSFLSFEMRESVSDGGSSSVDDVSVDCILLNSPSTTNVFLFHVKKRLNNV